MPKVKAKQIDGLPVIKAGTVAAGSFSGTPRTAAVTFTTAFPDNLYTVSHSAVITSNRGYIVTVQSKTSAGFTLNLNSNGTTNLTSVDWVAVDHGEF